MADDTKVTTDEETVQDVPVEELDTVAGGFAAEKKEEKPEIFRI